MKTLIIIALLFLVFKKKSLRSIIRCISKSVIGFFGALEGVGVVVTHFWARIFMEFSCSTVDEEKEKEIRAYFATWLELRKDYQVWFDKLKAESPESYAPTESIEQRIRAQNWVYYDNVCSANGAVYFFSAMTFIGSFITTIILLVIF